MGVPSIDEQKSTNYCLSPKIYQAPEDDISSFMESPRKKKMFSSSSFYEEPNCIYPTVQEQVKLCRQIAESLSDDTNLKSKGANMFFKRVKKAEKWIVTESNPPREDEYPTESDPSKIPYVRPRKGQQKLKLILDPRQIVDMKRLIQEGVDIVEHNAISPDVCHDIVKDLNSPTGKGAQLFARRKKKSEEWVVDENKVKHLLQERYNYNYSPEPPVLHPRVKALSEVNSQVVAESIIRAAEAKIMTYPNAVPHIPVIHSLDGSNSSSLKMPVQSSPWSPNMLKYSVPRGWAGVTTSSNLKPEPSTAQKRPLSVTPTSLSRSSSSLTRTMSFGNFNSSPRAWNADICTRFRPVVIKPVKPPSVLVQ